MSTFSKIHMGQRLEHFLKSAKHGQGINAFEAYSGQAKSSILRMYKHQSLDIVMIDKACEYFDVSLPEFLGISKDDLPDSFKVGAGSDPSLMEKKVNRIDKNVSQILEHLKK